MSIKRPGVNKGKTILPTPDLFPKSIFNYPVFCLKYIHKDFSLDHCDKSEKAALIERLYKLSAMTWEQIRMADKHGLGSEKINRDSIKAGIPSHVTGDITFYALRFCGKKTIVGYKSDFIFHILYIDRNFELYDHG